MKRRKFISITAVAAPMIGMFPACLSSIDREKIKGKIEKRSLGKTGEKLSTIGFGGIVVDKATTEEAASRVKEAIDRGINYFDVAPSYGNAEEMLGPALKPYRKDVFLACKTGERKKEGARRELRPLGRFVAPGIDHADHEAPPPVFGNLVAVDGLLYAVTRDRVICYGPKSAD